MFRSRKYLPFNQVNYININTKLIIFDEMRNFATINFCVFE